MSYEYLLPLICNHIKAGDLLNFGALNEITFNEASKKISSITTKINNVNINNDNINEKEYQYYDLISSNTKILINTIGRYEALTVATIVGNIKNNTRIIE